MKNELYKPGPLRSLKIGRAMRLVWESGRGCTIASLALVLVQAAVLPLTFYLMKLVSDNVVSVASGKAQGFAHVAWLIVGMAGASAVGIVCSSIATLVNEALGQAVTDHVHDVLHAKSIQVDLEYYENPQYHDMLHRARQEAPYRPTNILKGLVQVSQNGISLIAIAGLLLALHWSVLAVLVIATVPGIFVRLRYADKLYNWKRDRTSSERQAWYFHSLLTGDQQAKEIRLFGLGKLLMGRFRDLRRILRRERIDMATKKSAADLSTQLAGNFALFGAFGYIAYRTAAGLITIGDLIMYYAAFQRGQQLLQGLLQSLAALYEDNLFLANLDEFLDVPVKVLEPARPVPVPSPIRKGLVFENVSFDYPTGTRKVLDDICLEIRPGETIALVGENGAGKTTLVKLLCRLYDPTAGRITLDGIDLASFAAAELRRQISVVFQDYGRYHLSARENIWFGNTELSPGHEDIISAARRSGADEVIRSLPKGYDTVLGKWFEDGEELSIGQWQKVALARAFWREAPIVILDEPTSALDAKAEYEVFKKFHQLAAGRTAIIISHRLSTVKMADRVYVMEQGRLIEDGTHDQLVRRGGAYAKLFETQARYYR